VADRLAAQRAGYQQATHDKLLEELARLLAASDK